MGTWSTALFGNDIAIDVRENYLYDLRTGASNAKATRNIIEAYDDELADACEGAIVWTALAVTQWKVGRLQKRVRNKALQAIRNGGDLARWEEENTAREVASRKRVFESVRKKLQTEPPPEKKLRPIKVVVSDPPQENHWRKGEVIAYRRDSGKLALLLTEGVRYCDHFGHVTYFILLDWQGKKLPAADRIKKLKPLRDAATVYNKQKDPIPWDRIQRLKVRRSVSKHIYIAEDGSGVGGIQSSVSWSNLPESECQTMIEEWLDKTYDKERQKYLKNLV